MRKFLNWISPAQANDKWLYVCLLIVAQPLVFTVFGNYVSYFTLNLVFGALVIGVLLFDFIVARINKKKFELVKDYSFWFGAAFVFWLFLGSFFTINKQVTWLGIFEGNHVKESVFQFAFYFLFFCAARKTKKCNRYYLTSVMIWIMCLFILLGFVKRLGIEIPGFVAHNEYALVFYHQNHSGYLAVITATLAFSKFVTNATWKDRIPFAVAFSLHVVFLCVNGSMGPILATICSILFASVWFLTTKKWAFARKMAIVAVSFFAIFCIFDFVPKVKDLRSEPYPLYAKVAGIVCNAVGVEYHYKGEIVDGSDGWSRKAMWKDCLKTAAERPLFGTGTSTFEDAHSEHGLANPHNEYLEYASANGIPALMFYLAFVGSVIAVNTKRRKNLSEVALGCTFAVVGYLISAFFGCTIVCVLPQFFLVLGFASN